LIDTVKRAVVVSAKTDLFSIVSYFLAIKTHSQSPVIHSRFIQPDTGSSSQSEVQNRHTITILHRTCLKKCAKLVLSELRQISTNFDNFWHKEV